MEKCNLLGRRKLKKHLQILLRIKRKFKNQWNDGMKNANSFRIFFYIHSLIVAKGDRKYAVRALKKKEAKMDVFIVRFVPWITKWGICHKSQCLTLLWCVANQKYMDKPELTNTMCNLITWYVFRTTIHFEWC